MHHVPIYSSPLPPLPPPLPPATDAPPLPPPVTTPLFPPPPPPNTTPILPPLPPPIDQPCPPLPPDRCTPPPPPNQWRTSVPMPRPVATPLFQSDEGLSRYNNYAHNLSLSEHQPISTDYYGNDAPPTYGNFDSIEHNNRLHQVPRDTPTGVARPLFRSSSPLYQFHNPQHLKPRPHDFFERDVDRVGTQPVQGYLPFHEGDRGDGPEDYWGESSSKRYRPHTGEGHWSHDQSNIGYPPNGRGRMDGAMCPPIPGVPSPGIPCGRGPKGERDMVRKMVPAESIFDSPGRNTRPSHIVIILRGLPGSGKSHLAKLIKDKEASYSAPIPRILSIDTYFINEVEKVEKDRETGRRIKRKMEEYEYDQSVELLYRTSLLKQFNKTLSDGFFNMIVVDDVNNRISHFDQHWSNAKMKGYEAFVIELKESVETCLDRNIHNRTREEIQDLANKWEPTPPHFLQLDITSLLHPQDNSISEVDMEMEDSSSEGTPEEPDDHATNNVPNQPDLVKSRWEQDQSEDALDKLDGFAKRKRSHSTIESNKEQGLTLKEYLNRKLQELTDGGNKPQKKRVRWADMEAAKEEQRQKEIGFTIGSKWNEVSEEEIERILNNETPN